MVAQQTAKLAVSGSIHESHNSDNWHAGLTVIYSINLQQLKVRRGSYILQCGKVVQNIRSNSKSNQNTVQWLLCRNKEINCSQRMDFYQLKLSQVKKKDVSIVGKQVLNSCTGHSRVLFHKILLGRIFQKQIKLFIKNLQTGSLQSGSVQTFSLWLVVIVKEKIINNGETSMTAELRIHNSSKSYNL